MFVADMRKRFTLLGSTKALHRVRTEEAEGMFSCQIIPKLFKRDSGIAVSFRPKQRHHFTEGANPPAASRRPRHQRTHRLEKSILVRLPIDDEPGQRVSRIQWKVLFARPQRSEVQALELQFLLESLPVRRSCDDDGRFTCLQTGGDKSAQRLYEERIAFIELNEMLALPHLAPIRVGRQWKRVGAGMRRSFAEQVFVHTSVRAFKPQEDLASHMRMRKP